MLQRKQALARPPEGLRSDGSSIVLRRFRENYAEIERGLCQGPMQPAVGDPASAGGLD